MTRFLVPFVLLGSITFAPVHAQGTVEQHPFLDAKFAVSLGVFYPDRSIRLRANGTLEPATASNELIDIGVTYNYVKLDVGVDGSNWRGEIKTRYDGLLSISAPSGSSINRGAVVCETGKLIFLKYRVNWRN